MSMESTDRLQRSIDRLKANCHPSDNQLVLEHITCLEQYLAELNVATIGMIDMLADARQRIVELGGKA